LQRPLLCFKKQSIKLNNRPDRDIEKHPLNLAQSGSKLFRERAADMSGLWWQAFAVLCEAPFHGKCGWGAMIIFHESSVFIMMLRRKLSQFSVKAPFSWQGCG
jgi:hypothetical protein